MIENDDNYNYTVIIPHYNIPDLLMRCLESIPVRKDIQVIVIDDCSPGASEYLLKYPQLSRPYLEYYSTPIGGSAGRARNIGLNHAKGKWVICIDSDDLLVDNVDEILQESLYCEEDIIFYNYKTVYSDNLHIEANRHQYDYYFNDFANDKDETRFRYKFDSIWGKIIKRELIENHHIRCDETKFANDAGFSVRCGHYANKIKVVNKPFFIVTERQGSLASSQFSDNKSVEELETRLDIALSIRSFLVSENVPCRWNSNHGVTFFKHYPLSFFYYLFKKQITHPLVFIRLLGNVAGKTFKKIGSYKPTLG